MKLLMFSIYDKQTKAYLPPFTARTVGEATRLVRQAVNDRNTNFCKYPADYRLCRVGVFDDGDAVVDNASPIEVVAELLTLVDVPEQIFAPGVEVPFQQ